MLRRLVSLLIVIIAIVIGLLQYNGITLYELRGTSPAFVVVDVVKPEEFPDLTNKVVVVTGANAGLGRSSSKILANQGATVIMACRSMTKCKKAKKAISKEISNTPDNQGTERFSAGQLIPMKLDLSDFSSIREFASSFENLFDRLDSLLLNAGIAHTRFFMTKEFIEGQMAVNHFGHFLLTKLLRPLLESTEPSTVVVVSSGSHMTSYEEGVRTSMFYINDPMGYDPILAYGQSKLANILFAQELSEQMQQNNKKVYVNSLHPGLVKTEIARHKSKLIRRLLPYLYQFLGFSSDEAAKLPVYLCISPDIISNKISGKYFIPMGEMVEPHDHAKNITLQKELWNLSEKITARDSKSKRFPQN